MKVEADYTCLDHDYSGYHKNLIQLLFVIMNSWANCLQFKTMCIVVPGTPRDFHIQGHPGLELSAFGKSEAKLRVACVM